MRAFMLSICLACTPFQAIAGDMQTSISPDEMKIVESSNPPTNQSMPAPQTAERPDARCWPTRTVGIAESSKDYYASCGFDQIKEDQK